MMNSSSLEEIENVEVDREEFRYLERQALEGENFNDEDFTEVAGEDDENIFDFFKLRTHK